jgi:hypothetical protein
MKPIHFIISISLLGIIFFQACQSSLPFEAINCDYSELKSPLKDVNVAFETVEIDASEPNFVQLKKW